MKKTLSYCLAIVGTVALLGYFGFLWLNRHLLLLVTEDITFGISLKIWLEILFFTGLALLTAAILLAAWGKPNLSLPFSRPTQHYRWLGLIGSMLWTGVWCADQIFVGKMSLSVMYLSIAAALIAEGLIVAYFVFYLLHHRKCVAQWILSGGALLVGVAALILRLCLVIGIVPNAVFVSISMVAQIIFYLQFVLIAAAMCFEKAAGGAMMIWTSALFSLLWLSLIGFMSYLLWGDGQLNLPTTGLIALCNGASVVLFGISLVRRQK